MAIIMKSAMSDGDQPFVPRCLDRIAIETRSARHAHRKHLQSLRALGEERLVDRRILVCREARPRLEASTSPLPRPGDPRSSDPRLAARAARDPADAEPGTCREVAVRSLRLTGSAAAHPLPE